MVKKHSPVKRTLKKSVKHSPKKSVKRTLKKSVKRTLKKSVKRSVKRTPKKSVQKIDTSKLDRYSFTKHGYSSKGKMIERREALKKAVKAYGPEKVWKKLNLVGILNKNRSPQTSRVFIMDKNWLKRTYF